MRVGIFGGSFDPPHKGHLAVVEAAVRTAGLDQVLVIPSAGAYKENMTVIASAADRLNMCRLCFGSEPHCFVSDIEAHRNEWIPTIATVERLKKLQHRNDQLVLIVGADKLNSLPHWKRAEELFRLCEILVFPRNGIDPGPYVTELRSAGASVTVMDTAEAPGASSEIQSLLKKYESPQYLTPEVAGYIAAHWLYLDKNILTAEKLMTPKRWKHTLGVRSQAVEYALRHNIDSVKAALAAMLHDSAKCLPFEVMLSYAYEAGISEPTFLSSPAMLHGPVGAWIARNKYHINDPDVLNAITYHTVGRADMSKLEMCIFVADATEPGREQYPGLKRLRRLAERSLEAAVLLSLNLTKQYVLGAGKTFNPISDATVRWITPLVPEELLPLTRAALP